MTFFTELTKIVHCAADSETAWLGISSQAIYISSLIASIAPEIVVIICSGTLLVQCVWVWGGCLKCFGKRIKRDGSCVSKWLITTILAWCDLNSSEFYFGKVELQELEEVQALLIRIVEYLW